MFKIFASFTAENIGKERCFKVWTCQKFSSALECFALINFFVADLFQQNVDY